MTILPICIYGEAVLHRVNKPVTKFDNNLKKLISNMYETMDAAPGVGLAAPQIGVDARIFVWSYEDQNEGPKRGVAINPVLWQIPTEIGSLDVEAEQEGCLSFPGERFPLRRANKVILEAVDENNEAFTISATDWFARIFQHEYDHLNGIIYVDRLEHHYGKQALKVMKKNIWGRSGNTWMPGVDNLDA